MRAVLVKEKQSQSGIWYSVDSFNYNNQCSVDSVYGIQTSSGATNQRSPLDMRTHIQVSVVYHIDGFPSSENGFGMTANVALDSAVNCV